MHYICLYRLKDFRTAMLHFNMPPIQACNRIPVSVSSKRFHSIFFFLLINSMLSIYWIFGECISYCGFPEFYFLYISLTLTWILIHMLRLLFWYICSIYYNLYLSYQCYVSCAVVLFPEIPYLHFWFHSLFDAKKTIYLLIYWFPQVFSAIRHWILCEKNGHSDRP